ncbi:hypothetical protein Q9966_003988 [Columba livia]|nr:hypothetical protein Q9966_003988 [Columba livia]
MCRVELLKVLPASASEVPPHNFRGLTHYVQLEQGNPQTSLDGSIKIDAAGMDGTAHFHGHKPQYDDVYINIYTHATAGGFVSLLKGNLETVGKSMPDPSTHKLASAHSKILSLEQNDHAFRKVTVSFKISESKEPGLMDKSCNINGAFQAVKGIELSQQEGTNDQELDRKESCLFKMAITRAVSHLCPARTSERTMPGFCCPLWLSLQPGLGCTVGQMMVSGFPGHGVVLLFFPWVQDSA